MKRVNFGVALVAASSFALPGVAFAEESGTSGADLLIPKPAEFIPALVIFLVIWVLLAKFVWPVVMGVLDKREAHIKDSIDSAEQKEATAAQKLEEADAVIVDAHRQAAQIVLEARGDAEDERAKIIARAHEEAEEILAKARDHAADEQRRMYDSATDSIARVSVSIASKIIEEKLSADDELQRKMIKKYLAEVGTLDA